MKIVQEKCQTTSRVGDSSDSDNPHGGWVDDRAARVKKGLPGREGRHGGDPTSRSMDNAVFYNSLPPGMDVDDQETIDSRQQPLVTPGRTDFTVDSTAEDLARGFSKKRMLSTDEPQAGRVFYDEVTVDGKTGFLERNNTLDRS